MRMSPVTSVVKRMWLLLAVSAVAIVAALVSIVSTASLVP
ncbi:putative membrane protein [Mycobacterium kansasii]|uniref:Putative membrane protein n=1 Tax=Mycobacterium kansasii TaxID=1768 RepID=A0A1V3W9M0_MYCKA|nr:putative membrane protein [Mycobacterium kansasii]